MTPEEWLSKNTGYCAPMQARITPAQCKVNQRDELLCKKCEGLDMSSKSKCVKCGRSNMSIVAGGMCGKCYQANKKQQGAIQNQDAHEKIADHQREEVPAPASKIAPTGFISKLVTVAPDSRPGLFVDFTGHEALLESLQADCEDLSADIVWLLEQLDQGKLQRIA